ncbi:hypothetical protein [Notoacmeibacter sp. MSK16QG-6]|uniref:hypothetical protein n=1 Tax=Notoacmeibacter sp. MSK16QG-6 TaxID=2957982 RepID=UPI00209EE8A7|nr:hypothetical protein [Notoacmeibacter sp. MSK16QG-6]MCP1198044.1 hypothetical protein [Notoacmeibacter sp. MSK16QG-6]
MEGISGEYWPDRLGAVGRMITERASQFLPAPVAGLVEQTWWLLLIVFLLAAVIGWKLGARGRAQ